MLKSEFECLAMAEEQRISQSLYDLIDCQYIASNEDKQQFIRRVFGLCENTPETVLEKSINEAIRLNRLYLCGTDEEKLAFYDGKIRAVFSLLARVY